MSDPCDVAVQVTTEPSVVLIVDEGLPGPPGPPGPQGPPGGPGGGPVAYVHTQAVAASTWVIPNPLTFTPNITVIDSAGTQVEGDVVYAVGQVTVSFRAAFAGQAFLS